jgi:hypothetical protein
MTRTTRVPHRFVSPGGVRQTGGDLPLYVCNDCGREVVWAESRRTGRRYLANVVTSFRSGRSYYVGAVVHEHDPNDRNTRSYHEALEADGAEATAEGFAGTFIDPMVHFLRGRGMSDEQIGKVIDSRR